MRSSHTIKKIIRKRRQYTKSLLMHYEYIRCLTMLSTSPSESFRASCSACKPICNFGVSCRFSTEVASKKWLIFVSMSGGWNWCWRGLVNPCLSARWLDYVMLYMVLYTSGRWWMDSYDGRLFKGGHLWSVIWMRNDVISSLLLSHCVVSMIVCSPWNCGIRFLTIVFVFWE